MSKGVTFEKLLLEKDAEKLLRSVYLLKPEAILGFAQDEKSFDKLTAKVSRAMKRNKKVVAKIRGGK